MISDFALQKWSLKECLGRAGLAARGVVYVAISFILFLGAFAASEASDGADPKEAFSGIERWPAGELILFALGILLLSYTIFRFIQSFTEEQSSDWSSRFARLGMLASGMSYGLVGYTSLAMSIGQVASEETSQTKQLISMLLSEPFGRLAIVGLGLVFFGIAAAQAYRAISKRWTKSLDLSDTPQALISFSSFAIFGRAILILIVGISIIWAGWDADPSAALGITESLAWLRSLPFGFLLYFASGVVMFGYGTYGFVQTFTHKFKDQDE
jgi:hypothetical protein